MPYQYHRRRRRRPAFFKIFLFMGLLIFFSGLTIANSPESAWMIFPILFWGVFWLVRSRRRSSRRRSSLDDFEHMRIDLKRESNRAMEDPEDELLLEDLPEHMRKTVLWREEDLVPSKDSKY